MTAFCLLTSNGRAQNEVVLSYVTLYGFDDNDDGNPTHLGTDVISHAAVHDSANEDLGTYERPGTLAADVGFLSPGTKVYVPALERYYVMEDTCRECSEGVEGSIVVGKVTDHKSPSFGFDAQTGEYGDLIGKGIIDPAKVVRVALQDASSVAGLLVTTEAMVAERPKKDSGSPAMPGGGMGGMGGMDY